MQDEVSNELLEHFLDIIMSPAVMTDAPLVLLFYKAVLFFLSSYLNEMRAWRK